MSHYTEITLTCDHIQKTVINYGDGAVGHRFLHCYNAYTADDSTKSVDSAREEAQEAGWLHVHAVQIRNDLDYCPDHSEKSSPDMSSQDSDARLEAWCDEREKSAVALGAPINKSVEAYRDILAKYRQEFIDLHKAKDDERMQDVVLHIGRIAVLSEVIELLADAHTPVEE